MSAARLDLQALIEELDQLRSAFDDPNEARELSFGETVRLDALEKLEDALGGDLSVHEGDLIAEEDFEDYAREVAEERHGKALRNVSWPFTCIDWSQAATDLQSEYTSVEFDGTTYFYQD